MDGVPSTGVPWLDTVMQPKLSKEEVALRDLFVFEYLKDWDAIAASIRCGFNGTFAKEYAQRFMDETYVRVRIKQGEMALSGEGRKPEQARKRIIMAGLMREAHQWGGSQAARVSALTALAKVHGMDAPRVGARAGTNKAGQGVMMVPGIAKAEEWEAVAVPSQRKLVEATRST